MPDLRSFPVFDANGQIGRVLTTARFLDDRAEKTILLENGKELQVPANALEVRKDGSFFLREPIRSNRDQPPTEPRPVESQPIQQQPVEPWPYEQQEGAPPSTPDPVNANGTALPSASQSLPQMPSEALFQSGYDIETVNVDRLLDGPVQERHEGDTLILPVVEEVWVIEKKQYLRQEIRITKREKPVRQPQMIDRSKTN